MLARARRITSRIDDSFFETSYSWGMRWARIFWVAGRESVKVAVIARKRTFPLSVRRHQAKRRATAVISQALAQDLLQPGDYVFVLRPSINVMHNQQMMEEIQRFVSVKLSGQTQANCGKIEEIETKEVTL